MPAVRVLTCKARGVALRLEVRPVGRDLIAILTGGRAHAGAVALGYLNKRGRVTVRIRSAPHHREAEVLVGLARDLCKKFHCTVVVIGGIHFRVASRTRILTVIHLVEELRLKVRRLL
jgi:hypothetical protein